MLDQGCSHNNRKDAMPVDYHGDLVFLEANDAIYYPLIRPDQTVLPNVKIAILPNRTGEFHNQE